MLARQIFKPNAAMPIKARFFRFSFSFLGFGRFGFLIYVFHF